MIDTTSTFIHVGSSLLFHFLNSRCLFGPIFFYGFWCLFICSFVVFQILSVTNFWIDSVLSFYSFEEKIHGASPSAFLVEWCFLNTECLLNSCICFPVFQEWKRRYLIGSLKCFNVHDLLNLSSRCLTKLKRGMCNVWLIYLLKTIYIVFSQSDFLCRFTLCIFWYVMLNVLCLGVIQILLIMKTQSSNKSVRTNVFFRTINKKRYGCIRTWETIKHYI